MDKWEYLRASWVHNYWEWWKSIPFDDWANDLGSDGWEMLAYCEGPQNAAVCVFKRRMLDVPTRTYAEREALWQERIKRQTEEHNQEVERERAQ